MNEIGKILLFMVSCVLTNNYIFSRFLGCCPFLGVSNKVETAAGMGIAVTFVMAIASLFTKLLYDLVLVPLQLEYLNTISFIIVIASLVQLVEMFIKKTSPSLYKSLGVYLPLITTNCVVLNVCLENIQQQYDFVHMLVYSVATPLGFALVLYIFSTIRERLDACEVPNPFKGNPIALIVAGIMALAFGGLAGLV